jgi:hypothetical protein
MLRVHPLGRGKARFEDFVVLWALGLRAFRFWVCGLGFVARLEILVYTTRLLRGALCFLINSYLSKKKKKYCLL